MKRQKSRVDWSDNDNEQYEYSNSPRSNKESKPSILLNTDKRVRELNEQLKNLN